MRGREIEVAVLGNDAPVAATPGEIIPHREFYDYTAKYLEDGSRWEIPAKLHQRPRPAACRSLPCAPFCCLECAAAWPASISFLERSTGRIYLNEINTIPGFTSISMYPKMWEASGVPYRDLISKLIDLALAEHAEKARTKYAIELPAGTAVRAQRLNDRPAACPPKPRRRRAAWRAVAEPQPAKAERRAHFPTSESCLPWPLPARFPIVSFTAQTRSEESA